MVRGGRERPSSRHQDDRHDHVRSCRPITDIGRGTYCGCAICKIAPAGFTEFVPLPFVPMETPIHLRGGSRLGPTYPRSRIDACGRPPRSSSSDEKHPDVVGEDGARRRCRLPQSGCQRSRRHIDEREHHARRRRCSRRGNGAESDGRRRLRLCGRRPRQRTTLYGEASATGSLLRSTRCRCGRRRRFQHIDLRAAPDPQANLCGDMKSGDMGGRGWNLAYACRRRRNPGAVVQRAEELGFTYAWFYDTQLLSADVLVAMGAAAMKTSRIKLCAGVFIPSNRIAPVAANALATLNALGSGPCRVRHIDWIYRPADHGSRSGDARSA